MFCADQADRRSSSGSMPMMLTAKAPSRLVASPPVLMRREAASTWGWASAAWTIGCRHRPAAAAGSRPLCRGSPAAWTWMLPPRTLMALP